jgi:aspartate aminotransferase
MSRDRFSQRVGQVRLSPTQKVAQEADALRSKGVDIINLGPGEPDFDTPVHIKEAAKAALDDNFTKYTTNIGIVELREAICQRYSEDCGLAADPDNVIVSAGGKQALFNVAMAVLDPGDEVIVHAPGWPTIVDQVRMVGSEVTVVRTHPEDRFRVGAEQIIESLTPRTRMVVINSPCNPTGGLIAEDDLREIAVAVENRDIWITLDLCYDRLIYDNTPHNLPAVLQEIVPNRCAIVGSLSKTYAMTGWRCGWTMGPKELIDACSNVQSQSTSNASSISQRAGVVALTESQECVRQMRDEYLMRRDWMIEQIHLDSRISCAVPGGAFYIFPDISQLLSPSRLRTSMEFTAALLQDGRLAVTPGEAFDAPGFLRISYAASMNQLKEGMKRFSRFIAELKEE